MSKLLADFCINPLLFEKKKTNFATKRRRRSFSTKKIQTNKGSEVIMPEYEHNREERMRAVMDAAVASKESATEFLIRAGILEPSGEFAPHLR